jgi:hypothetical protein
VSYAGIELTGVLGDVVFLAIVVAFFALCLLFVRACAAIAGPEPADVTEGGEAVLAPQQVEARPPLDAPDHVEVTA